MAKVISQALLTDDLHDLNMTSEVKHSISQVYRAISKIMTHARGKKLSQCISLLYAELAQIPGLEIGNPDQNGNITTTLDGGAVRLATAIGVQDALNNTALFGRKEGEKQYDEKGNKNPLLDLIVAAKAIISEGSIRHKAGEAYLDLILDEITPTGYMAYEQTDGDGDAQHIVMPVYAARTIDAFSFPDGKAVQVQNILDFKKLPPDQLTAKARAFQIYMQSH